MFDTTVRRMNLGDFFVSRATVMSRTDYCFKVQLFNCDSYSLLTVCGEKKSGDCTCTDNYLSKNVAGANLIHM